MNRTILVVDDEKNIVDILRFNLEREGYSVLCAYDGKEGLRLAQEKMDQKNLYFINPSFDMPS